MPVHHSRPADRRTYHGLGRILIALLTSLVALVAVATPAQAATHSEILLFNGGGETLYDVLCHSFRVPSLVRLSDGTLLAFAEGRTSSNKDYGNVNIVLKRSPKLSNGAERTDGNGMEGALGQVVGSTLGTWSNPTAVVGSDDTVYPFMNYTSPGVCENCAPDPSGNSVPGYGNVDRYSDRLVYLTKSTDEGTTWSTPVDMSATLKPMLLKAGDPTSSWNWDTVDPGVGTKLSDGTLVVPAMHRDFYSTAGSAP